MIGRHRAFRWRLLVPFVERRDHGSTDAVWQLDQHSRASATQRRQAVLLGWNDGAFGRPRRVRAGPLARWYEQGYAGGLVFRRNKQHDSNS